MSRQLAEAPAMTDEQHCALMRVLRKALRDVSGRDDVQVVLILAGVGWTTIDSNVHDDDRIEHMLCGAIVANRTGEEHDAPLNLRNG